MPPKAFSLILAGISQNTAPFARGCMIPAADAVSEGAAHRQQTKVEQIHIQRLCTNVAGANLHQEVECQQCVIKACAALRVIQTSAAMMDAHHGIL